MPDRHPYAGADLLGLCIDCGRPEAFPGHEPHPIPAAAMNATHSPTGRVRAAATPTSVTAAVAAAPRGNRQIILTSLLNNGLRGVTSIEAAHLLPPRRDTMPQPPNIAAARLGELWEAGQATIKRVWGVCVLGQCHPHTKPQVVHRPSAPCGAHGAPETRDGASIWISTRFAP